YRQRELRTAAVRTRRRRPRHVAQRHGSVAIRLPGNTRAQPGWRDQLPVEADGRLRPSDHGWLQLHVAESPPDERGREWARAGRRTGERGLGVRGGRERDRASHAWLLWTAGSGMERQALPDRGRSL